MPAPVTVLRTGTGWTVDVTSLQLSPNLGFKDIYVTVGGVASLLADYTKTSANLITYTGVALPASSVIQVLRDSTRLVTDFAFNDINSSAQLNSRFVEVERVLEDLRIFFSIVGTLIATVNLTSTSTGVTAATADNSTLVATTAYVKNNLASYVLTTTLANYVTNSTLSNYATLATLASYVSNGSLATTLAGYITSAALASALAPYAPLTSPVLTGTPTASTAALGNSSGQLATTQFVQRMGRPFLSASRITSNLALTQNAYTVIAFNNALRDVDLVFNNTTGAFIPSKTGWYNISVFSRTTLPAGGASVVVTLFAGAVSVVRLCEGVYGAGSQVCGGSQEARLTAGVSHTLQMYQTAIGSVLVAEPSSTARDNSFFSISYLGDDV